MKQTTFMMLKPDAFTNQIDQDVLAVLKQHHLVIEQSSIVEVDMYIMKCLLAHYCEVIEEMPKAFHFPQKLFNTFYYDGPHYIMPMKITYTGHHDIIMYTRTLIGKTNPAQADPQSIRGMFSKDSYVCADQEDRLVNNIIHASDSVASAKRELKIWEAILNDEKADA